MDVQPVHFVKLKHPSRNPKSASYGAVPVDCCLRSETLLNFCLSPLQREVVTFAHGKLFRILQESFVSLCKKATYTSDKWRSLRGSNPR